MKTEYENVHFVHMPYENRMIWTCAALDDSVAFGHCEYDHEAEQHVFLSNTEGHIYTAGHLADIQHFMSQLEKPGA